jgi:hypothetical protein
MVIAWTVSQNFRRCFAFVARTERTEAFIFDDDALSRKVAGTPGAIRGDDHPAAGYRVFAQFGHCPYLTSWF